MGRAFVMLTGVIAGRSSARAKCAAMALLCAVGAVSAGAPASAVPPPKSACAQLTSDCDAAIAAERDPKARSVLLLRRGYLKNGLARYLEALPDLDTAVALDPANANALHERAYAESSLMRYADALRDLDAQARLTPTSPDVYQERAFSRLHTADLQGALDDWSQVARLRPGATALQGRANAEMWLGRFDKAAADLKTALGLARAAGDNDAVQAIQRAQAALALWQTTSPGPLPDLNCDAADRKGVFGQPGLIGDCTAAFLHARTGTQKATALTTRAAAWWFGQHDPLSGRPDQEMAVAVDPGNPSWRANLGFVYLRGRHSWEALQQFDRSIALKPTFASLAGRAAARYNLGDQAGALADARSSNALRANDVALTVLGDVALSAQHRPQTARAYWLAAYRLGGRDDGLTARLRQVGVDAPEKVAIVFRPRRPHGRHHHKR
jgi:tetratricopeptide (TPR) repeat protein